MTQHPRRRGGELPISEIGLRTSPEIFVFAPTENICRVTTAAARRRKRRDAARCKGECHLGTGAGDNWLHPAPGPGVRRSPTIPGCTWSRCLDIPLLSLAAPGPGVRRSPTIPGCTWSRCLGTLLSYSPLTATASHQHSTLNRFTVCIPSQPHLAPGGDTAARSLSCHQCLQCLHVTSPHTLPVVSTASME